LTKLSSTNPTLPGTFWQCRWPGAVVLLMIGLFMALSFARVVHFWWYHSESTWEALEPPTTDDIDDPLYKMISKLRLRCCQEDRKFNRIDRVRGEFVKPEQDTSEPERTERLLAHPYRLFHAHAGDAIDSNKLLWLNRASGSYGAVGVFYEFILLLVQLCIGVLTGLGPSIEPGSQAAYNQMGTVLTLQYGTALYAFTCGPSADRIDNTIVVCQYTIEGTCTLLLLYQARVSEPMQIEIQMTVFFLLLVSMFLPLFEKGYDLFVVQLAKACQKDMTWAECGIACCAFMLLLPGAISNFLGFNSDGLVETMLDESVNTIASMTDDTDAFAEAFDRAFFAMRQKSGANKIRKAWKRHAGSSADKNLQTAATNVQRLARGHLSRRSSFVLPLAEDSADRGSKEHQTVEAEEKRPGSQWLESEVQRHSQRRTVSFERVNGPCKVEP